jgi:ATP-dependent DNA ligase
VNGAERATSGRAKCRSCRETIAKDTWRIPLVYWEEGRFEASGFVHSSCVREYFGTTEILSRVGRFSPGLSDEELGELRGELERAEEDSTTAEQSE